MSSHIISIPQLNHSRHFLSKNKLKEMTLKPIRLSFLLSLIITTFCCTSNEFVNYIASQVTSLYFPPIDSDEWETISPEVLGWNPTNLQVLLDFLNERETKAFIVLKEGKIAIEWYGGGANENTNLPWNSAGKTLSAFMVGIAQQEGFLNIDNSSQNYLDNGWSSLTDSQELNITVKQHLTMTTGLDYTVANLNCHDSDCLYYLNAPDSFWYYHNAAYTLTQNIIEGATDTSFNTFFNEQLKHRIGMQGTWLNVGYNKVYFSNARSMARFGLLNLNKGLWNTAPILNDLNYVTEMTNSSQYLNKAYGYLWWLNGKESFRSPGSTMEFEGKLIPNAPDDLFAGLGKNDQKLYIVPSKNLVIVRLGNNAGESVLGASSFDNELWEKINLTIN